MSLARRLLQVVPLLAWLIVPAVPAAAAGASDLFAGFQADSKDPVNVDAAALDVFEEGKQRVSVFSGGVTVTRGATTLKAGSIKLYSSLDAKASKTGAFTRIEALGKVFVSSGPQTVTGQKAVVDMASQVITLTGNVVLSQGTSVMTGEKLVVDLRTGRARLEQAPGKRIQGVITPETMKAATPDGSGPASP
ncbi:MAG TPA: LptA/OstA family protein [Bauldia sp.]|nr:LptA/OstA family protein [Bauldia sp.]